MGVDDRAVGDGDPVADGDEFGVVRVADHVETHPAPFPDADTTDPEQENAKSREGNKGHSQCHRVAAESGDDESHCSGFVTDAIKIQGADQRGNAERRHPAGAPTFQRQDLPRPPRRV